LVNNIRKNLLKKSELEFVLNDNITQGFSSKAFFNLTHQTLNVEPTGLKPAGLVTWLPT